VGSVPLILLSQNRQGDTDRIEAERDYAVNQRALRYLTIFHRDAHEDGECAEMAGPGGEQDFSVPPAALMNGAFSRTRSVDLRP
jgi:Protein of unknown function (DUF1003)